jgi:hypothetical protein
LLKKKIDKNDPYFVNYLRGTTLEAISKTDIRQPTTAAGINKSPSPSRGVSWIKYR